MHDTESFYLQEDVVLRDEQKLENQTQVRVKLRQAAIEKGMKKNERVENERMTPVTTVAEQLLRIQCSTAKEKTEKAGLQFLHYQRYL